MIFEVERCGTLTVTIPHKTVSLQKSYTAGIYWWLPTQLCGSYAIQQCGGDLVYRLGFW